MFPGKQTTGQLPAGGCILTLFPATFRPLSSPVLHPDWPQLGCWMGAQHGWGRGHPPQPCFEGTFSALGQGRLGLLSVCFELDAGLRRTLGSLAVSSPGLAPARW